MTHEEFQKQCDIILSALCTFCPHRNDKHDMNCLECCPLGRSKDKVRQTADHLAALEAAVKEKEERIAALTESRNEWKRQWRLMEAAETMAEEKIVALTAERDQIRDDLSGRNAILQTLIDKESAANAKLAELIDSLNIGWGEVEELRAANAKLAELIDSLNIGWGEVEELRAANAKLAEAIRYLKEALEDAICITANAGTGHIGDHYVYTPQISFDTVARWKAALKGKESDALLKALVHQEGVKVK